MILTKHAETRIQQRCIPKLALDLLIEYGAVEHQHGGTELLYFKAKNFEKARKQLERTLREFDKLKDVYMIKNEQADEHIVVTTGYLTGSPRTKTRR